ncbi:MAG: RCC1 domain-containing protein, partial [Myxococcaceae bacterium]
QLAPIDNYFGFIGELLEQKQIEDAHLLRMISAAEEGQVVNPITEQESRINLKLEVARQALDRIMTGYLDVSQITPWATERLSQQTREYQEKKRKQEETKLTWKRQSSWLAVGKQHACAVKAADHHVECWGFNGHGQRDVPTELGSVSSVYAAYCSTCAVTVHDYLHCWGDNRYGQSDVPVDLGVVMDVYIGDRYVCAIKPNRSVRCWGDQTTVPTDLEAAPSLWTSFLDNFREYRCTVMLDTSVECWGSSYFSKRSCIGKNIYICAKHKDIPVGLKVAVD